MWFPTKKNASCQKHCAIFHQEKMAFFAPFGLPWDSPSPPPESARGHVHSHHDQNFSHWLVTRFAYPWQRSHAKTLQRSSTIAVVFVLCTSLKVPLVKVHNKERLAAALSGDQYESWRIHGWFISIMFHSTCLIPVHWQSLLVNFGAIVFFCAHSSFPPFVLSLYIQCDGCGNLVRGSMAGVQGLPWIPQAPNFHIAIQLLNYLLCCCHLSC